MERNVLDEYSKLIVRELESLNKRYDELRKETDVKISEILKQLSELRGIDSKLTSNSQWIEKVNDVWSPSQMKEGKDEIYKQKNRWVGAIAIVTFVQILIGMIIALWGKFH